MISSHTWEALMETSVRQLVFAEDGHCHGIVGNILSASRPRLMKWMSQQRWTNAFRTIKQREYKERSSLLLLYVCRGLPCSFSLCVTISTFCCRHWNQTVPGSCRACHAHLDVCVCASILFRWRKSFPFFRMKRNNRRYVLCWLLYHAHEFDQCLAEQKIG